MRGIEYLIAKDDAQEKTEHVPKKDPVLGAELPLQDTYVSKEDGLNPRYIKKRESLPFLGVFLC